MGSSAISVREEGGHSARFDRHPDRGASGIDEGAAARCDEAAGIGQVLSAASFAQETQATRQIGPDEVGLHELWFALSCQQRTQFGGHFSEMLLRVVRRRTGST